MPLERRLKALLAALRLLYHAETQRDPEAAPLLARVLAALDAAPPPRPVERRELPVCALLPAALVAAEDGPLAALAAAFGELEPHLSWTQNPNYSDERLGEGYMAGYGYCDVAGPRGLLATPDVAVGVLLLGPGRLYPDHNHPAAEVYHVLSGTAGWQRDDGAWQLRPAGSCVVHRPWQRHAMRTGEDSLLALYAWVGDVHRAADLVS